MGEPFFSASWYRVAQMRPRLRDQTIIRRHQYRGHGWYVIYDKIAGRVHRFTPAAYLLIGRMDGTRTVEDLWQQVLDELGDDAPSQDETIRLLARLYGSDLLASNVSTDVEDLLQRYEQQESARFKQRVINPMALRLPLLDPDRFLTATLPLVRWLFTWFGALLWFCLVGTAAVLAVMHWSELTEDIADRVLTAQNLLLVWLVYPLIKALHELAHGYATKIAGGECREVGIMFLVFFPVPYVDASSAAAFPSKWARMLVGAAGILVELAVASAALIFWLQAEPGLLRALAFNAMLIGGVSTLLFNGNPLLRFDGYYVLSDAIEIPNLAKRSTDYWGHLVETRLFGVPAEEDDLAPLPGERLWLLFYAPSAFLYRLVVIFTIALFVGQKFLGIGLLLAAWGIGLSLVWPALKALWRVISNPRLARQRLRAVGLTAGAITALAAMILTVPVPLHTNSQGVLWLPETAYLRSGTNGFVEALLVEPRSVVQVGEALVESRNPLLAGTIATTRARLDELRARHRAALVTDLVQARLFEEEIAEEEARLDRVVQEQEELVATSQGTGLFILPNADSLIGQYRRRGELLGYVLDPDTRLVRVVVGQNDADLVRTRLRGIEVRPDQSRDTRLRATMVREVPAAGAEVPAPALTTEGGGPIALDPTDPQARRALQSFFQFDIAVAEPMTLPAVQGRYFVRFDHGLEPLGQRWYRRGRQLFLSYFDV